MTGDSCHGAAVVASGSLSWVIVDIVRIIDCYSIPGLNQPPPGYSFHVNTSVNCINPLGYAVLLRYNYSYGVCRGINNQLTSGIHNGKSLIWEVAGG